MKSPRFRARGNRLRHLLIGHSVETAFELGWATLQNGALIAMAEESGFEVFVTTDKNLKYQQNLNARRLVLTHMSEDMLARLPRIEAEWAEDGKCLVL